MPCEPKPRFIPQCTNATLRRKTRCSALRKIKSKSPSSPSTAYPSPTGANTSGSSLSNATARSDCDTTKPLSLYSRLYNTDLSLSLPRRKGERNAHFPSQSITFASRIVSVLSFMQSKVLLSTSLISKSLPITIHHQTKRLIFS